MYCRYMNYIHKKTIEGTIQCLCTEYSINVSEFNDIRLDGKIYPSHIIAYIYIQHTLECMRRIPLDGPHIRTTY